MFKKSDIGLKEFKLNEEGTFSITRPYESNQIIYFIQTFIAFIGAREGTNELLINKILTDGTACMGGDLIRFSNYFQSVNGVEIDENNFSLLVENCKQFNCNNVNLFPQDYLEIYDKLKQDIIYLDPKWGGIDYKNKLHVVLKMNDMDISDLIKLIKHKKLCKYIFIKAPSNVYIDKIDYDAIHVIYNKSKSPSFKLICIYCK